MHSIKAAQCSVSIQRHMLHGSACCRYPLGILARVKATVVSTGSPPACTARTAAACPPAAALWEMQQPLQQRRPQQHGTCHRRCRRRDHILSRCSSPRLRKHRPQAYGLPAAAVQYFAPLTCCCALQASADNATAGSGSDQWMSLQALHADSRCTFVPAMTSCTWPLLRRC